MQLRLRALAALTFSLSLASAASAAAPAAPTISIANVSPGIHAAVHTRRPAIEFDLKAVKRVEIDRSAIHVQVDEHDVSDEIDVTGSHVSYAPTWDMMGGVHDVTVTVTGPTGEPSVYSWEFNVDSMLPRSSADQSAPADANYTSNTGYAYGGDYGGDYGGVPFGFYPASANATFVAGTPVRFFVNGPIGGYGYISVGGLPSLFPIVVFAPGIYTGVVNVPPWFGTNNPFIVCHFFTPGYRSWVVPLDRHVAFARPSASGSAAHAPPSSARAPMNRIVPVSSAIPVGGVVGPGVNRSTRPVSGGITAPVYASASTHTPVREPVVQYLNNAPIHATPGVTVRGAAPSVSAPTLVGNAHIAGGVIVHGASAVTTVRPSSGVASGHQTGAPQSGTPVRSYQRSSMGTPAGGTMAAPGAGFGMGMHR